MPAAYAHYVFGQKVLKELPRSIQERIKDYLPLYHIGIHGPDILFYYDPLHKNEVNKQGYDMHDEEAFDFFKRAQDLIISASGEKKEAMEAYVAGFICHFILDSECHGYIGEMMEKNQISHSEIETEFDAMLMRKKGLDPHKRNSALHLNIHENSAKIIAPFFDLDSKTIYKAVQSMKKYQQLLLPVGKPKRILLNAALKISGKYDSLHGMVVNETPNELCVESNIELLHRLKNAVELCADLIEEYLQECNAEREINERFHRNFE